jgi:hypothetical protein
MALIIDGPGALDGDLEIIGDTLFGRDPELRYRVRASAVLVLLLIAYDLMPTLLKFGRRVSLY